jgi:hypothetical protein
MVQRFSKLQRIDQRPAGPVVPVQLVQVLARDQERGDALAIVPDTDLGQIAAAAQKKRSSKYVRGLKTAHVQSNHLLSCFFRGDAIEKKAVSEGFAPLGHFPGHQLRPAKVIKLMAFFLSKTPF